MYKVSEAIFEASDTIRIKFPKGFLDESVIEKINSETYELETDRLILSTETAKYAVLAYKINDSAVGVFLNEICVISSDLGFVITPAIHLQELKIIRCFEMSKKRKMRYSFIENDKYLEMVIKYDFNA